MTDLDRLAKLMIDLEVAGIRKVIPEGQNLRLVPAVAIPPELLARVKARKPAILEALTASNGQPTPSGPMPTAGPGPPARVVCRCGSTTWRDVPIHGGQSVRRDCGKCGRTLGFPTWYGKALTVTTGATCPPHNR